MSKKKFNTPLDKIDETLGLGTAPVREPFGDDDIVSTITCFAEADAERGKAWGWKASGKPYPGALGFHYPAREFWDGFARHLVIQHGWSIAEVETLIKSKYIRHGWDEELVSTKALGALGIDFARQILKKNGGTRRLRAEVKSWK